MELWKAKDVLTWSSDEHHLPSIDIHAELPMNYPSADADIKMDETDPWFILGNYGLTIFPHISGSYQFFHCEHGFARLNYGAGECVTSRACQSMVHVGDKEVDLLTFPASKKVFGCGYAKWIYNIGEVEIERMIATLPSKDSCDRIPAFKVVITARNQGPGDIPIKISEGIGARYDLANWHNQPLDRQYADYPAKGITSEHTATATFTPVALKPLIFEDKGRLAQADAHPPQVHLSLVEGEGVVRVQQEDEHCVWLHADSEIILTSGSEGQMDVLIGWSNDDVVWSDTVQRMQPSVECMRKAWAQRLPAFDAAEPALRGELHWHAHVLYAMATWDDRYQTTFIPQGNLYEYAVGSASCTRDHCMHALPACTYDPDLARSVLRYLARITDPRGRVEHSNEGAGIYPIGGDQKSDNELFCLLLAAEYFEKNNDIELLKENQPFFPPGTTIQSSFLDRIGRWVKFLRDGIHTGANGMIRIMLSDLSDTLHSAFPHLQYSHPNYRKVFDGESYVNTTMSLHVLRRMGNWLQDHAGKLGDQATLAKEIAAACEEIESRIRHILFEDIKDRPWVPRGRVGDHVLGEEDAFAAPQIFILSNPDLPEERRNEIWNNVRPRIWKDEPYGVLLREGEGRHRCGMVWFAWSGMFITELAGLDKEAAKEGLERMSLRRRAEITPDQWVGLWSNSDCTWGFSGDFEQVPGTCRVGYMKPFPHFCAHVHAWPLMIWLRLQETQ